MPCKSKPSPAASGLRSLSSSFRWRGASHGFCKTLVGGPPSSALRKTSSLHFLQGIQLGSQLLGRVLGQEVEVPDLLHFTRPFT